MKKLFSGIQPSGVIHIGNYLGAVKNWMDLQDRYESIFCVVDLHALTVYQKPEELRENTLNTAALLLAAGINPTKSNLFIQSHIPEHSELAWILNTITHMGELTRMTQFKEKTAGKENIGVGLFDYPVLMAADILLYKTDAVPVGEDQIQHIELARDLAQRFNHLYGRLFTLPEPILMEKGARVMSLLEPTKKMSKSAENKDSYIGLLDPPQEIRKKISRAVTDSGSEIRFDLQKKPAISNLLTIFSLFADVMMASLEKRYEDKGYAEFKSDLADILIEKLNPIQKNYQKIVGDKAELEKILEGGRRKVQPLAEEMTEKVRKAVGLWSF